MADSAALRQQRSRAHRSGDHSLCPSLCPRRPDVVLVAVRAELATAGCLDTYLGAAAVQLADRIDQSVGSAPGLAGMVRELRATMYAALAGNRSAADPVDEIRARRDRIRASGTHTL